MSRITLLLLGALVAVFVLWSTAFGQGTDPYESNDDVLTAYGISYGDSLNATIGIIGDVDYYSFAGTVGDTITAEVQGGGTLILTLFDTDGVTKLDSVASFPQRIIHPLSSTGTFFLQVREMGVVGDLSYSLTLKLGAPPLSDPYEPNDEMATAFPIAYGDSVYARIDPYEDVDYYSFTGSAGDTVTVEFVGRLLYGDWYYTIMTDTWTSLASGDFSYGDTTSAVFLLPDSGTFFINISSMMGGPSAYYSMYLFWKPEVEVRIPDDLVGASGDTIRIPVGIMSDVTGLEIVSAQMEITYDGSILIPIRQELVDTITDETWEMHSGIAPGVDGEPDTMKVAMAGANPLSSEGVLVWGVFAVSDTATPDEYTSLDFERFMFNEGTPDAYAYPGFFQVVSLLVGDVSENGEVTAFDAAIILRYRVGYTDESEYPGLRPKIADVTRSDGVTALDASYILQYVVGLVPELPVSPEYLTKPVVAMRRVWLGTPERSSDGVRVPLFVDEMAGILSGEIELSFAGSEVEVGASDLTSDYLFASRVSEGKVRVAFAGAESPEGEGALAYLRIGVPFDELDLSALRLDRVELNDGGIVVRIGERSDMPTEYRLAQNRPNPFNPNTTIQFELPAFGRVVLGVYNVNGQLVRTLVSGFRDAGVYTAMWDGTDAFGRSVSSGVYFYRLEANTFSETKKMLLMK